MRRPIASQYGSRRRRLKIFPLSSRGSEAWNVMFRGTLYLAMRGTEKRDDIVDADCRIRRRLDDGHQRFAKVGVRDSKHRAVSDAGHCTSACSISAG